MHAEDKGRAQVRNSACLLSIQSASPDVTCLRSTPQQTRSMTQREWLDRLMLWCDGNLPQQHGCELLRFAEQQIHTACVLRPCLVKGWCRGWCIRSAHSLNSNGLEIICITKDHFSVCLSVRHCIRVWACLSSRAACRRLSQHVATCRLLH